MMGLTVRNFFRNLGNLVLSVFLASLVWIAAVREQNPPREADYVQAIPIETISPPAGLVTTDRLPETVRLRLLAPENSWSTLTPSKFKATLDLSQLPEGLNDVPVQISISDPQVRIIEQTPRSVGINLQPEQTISISVNVVLMDEPPLGYITRAPTAMPTTVSVTGPISVISQVDEAVSEIFIRNAKETINRSSDVIIRNRDDQIISGLEIKPSKIQVTVPIEQRFGYKDVSVSAIVDGQPAPGYWVSNISVEPARLTVVGNPQALSSIPGFVETTPIDVSDATINIVQLVPLNLPDGVTVVLSENQNDGAGGVRVTVRIEAIESGQTMQLPITQQGIDPDYIWTASPERADVILSGPIPRLQTLKPDDVKVIVDLFGLPPGIHKVQPTIFRPDDLHLEALLPDTVEITISPNPRLATPTLVLTTTITSTQTISATMTPTPRATVTPTRRPRATVTSTP
jgi:YbbR domain-containing protein